MGDNVVGPASGRARPPCRSTPPPRHSRLRLEAAGFRSPHRRGGRMAVFVLLIAALAGAAGMDGLGHSWGGYLAMAYAARHPEHVAHLVICDSAAPKWADTVFLFKDIFPETVTRQDAVAFAEELGDSAAARQSFRDYLS